MEERVKHFPAMHDHRFSLLQSVDQDQPAQIRLAYRRLQLSGTLVMKIRKTRKFSGTMLRWLPSNIY